MHTSIVVLIPFILITAVIHSEEKVAAKPHIFYHGSFYSWDKKSGESSLKELADTLIQDGTIDTLLDMTEVCYDDFQTNEEYYLNARVYRLKNGDESIIYLHSLHPVICYSFSSRIYSGDNYWQVHGLISFLGVHCVCGRI